MSTSNTNKRNTLIALLVVWAVAGILEVILDSRSPYFNAYYLAHMLLTSLLALLWVVYDAAGRTYQPSATLRLMICLAAILAVPYYLLRSRGTKGLLAILQAAAFLGLLAVTMAATQYLTAIVTGRPLTI